MARLDSEMVGDIFRSALLVLAFWGVISGLWPAIGGISGQYAGAAESSTVHKPVNVATAEWETEVAPSQTWIKVHVSSNIAVKVQVFASNTRNVVCSVSNTSVVTCGEFLAIANGIAEGTDVTIYGGHGGPVRYRIAVHIAESELVHNFTDKSVDYTLTWEVQKMDPMVIVGGLILFNMFFVTEYMLHVRRDVRSLSKRVERMGLEGARAPSAALGVPVAAALADEEPREKRGRGGIFGRGRREEPARPAGPSASAALEAAPLYSPPPAATRYAAAAPPDPYAPPSYSPPAYAPPSYAAPPYSPPPAYSPPPPPEPEPAPYEPPAAYEPPPPPATRPATARMAPPPPSPPPPPPGATEGEEPVSKVRCPQCKHIVPVYTAERPTPIKCPNCGKRGMLTK